MGHARRMNRSRLKPVPLLAYLGIDRTPFGGRHPMNKLERGGGEAVVEYLDSNLRLVKPGAFVRCAVTGEAIPLDQLKYWSVEHQEAYVSPEAVLKRLGVSLRKA